MTVVVPAGICGTRRDCHNVEIFNRKPQLRETRRDRRLCCFFDSDVSSLYTDLGECAWSCEHCAAMFWYGERLKGYSKVQTVRYHTLEKRYMDDGAPPSPRLSCVKPPSEDSSTRAVGRIFF
ncbi:hypothetical protein Tco_0632843 [Tanacetum coccineum]